MKGSPGSFIDHTLLKADASEKAIRKLCLEALKFGFASVCVPPIHVPAALTVLSGSSVAVGSVVGFPLGYSTSSSKVFEAEKLVEAGADELDMVINISLALEKKFDKVGREIRQVVESAGNSLVKVILECCYLENEAKEELAHLAIDAGASFVKTSTGFAFGGATLEDVRLLVHCAEGRAGVKASGGIRNWESCGAFLQAGATRIGTSHGIAIMEEWSAGKD
jgi:deoxyribose-phosphate aldolase